MLAARNIAGFALKSHQGIDALHGRFARVPLALLGAGCALASARVSVGGGPRVMQTRFWRSSTGFVCVILGQLHSRTRGLALCSELSDYIRM